MADQNALQDKNQVFTLLGASGTAGTAESRRVIVDDDGNLKTSASVSAPGTQDMNLIEVAGNSVGTLYDSGNDAFRVNVVAGGAGGGDAQLKVRNEDDDEWVSVGFGTSTSGTYNVPTHVRSGTVSVSALPDLPGGTIDSITAGNIAVTAGTIDSFTADIPGGTIDNITTLPDIPGGTLNVLTTVSNLTNGSVHVTNGTISGALPAGNNNIGNVDVVTLPDLPGGTIDSVGSVSNVAQVHNAGTVNALPDLPGGTVDSVTEVANVAAGTITRVEGGTITVSNPGGTEYTEGDTDTTISGKAFLWEDSADTLRVVSAAKPLPVDLGTNNDVVVTAGTIGAFTADIPGGTIDNVGSVVGAGSVSNVAQVHNAGTINALPDLPGGTVDSVTTVSNLTNGSVAVTAGTITSALPAGDNNIGNVDVVTLPDLPGGTVDAVTTVSNLTNGSVAVTAGTISAFTADIPGGTIDSVTTLPDLPGGTVDSVSNLAGGTVQLDAKNSRTYVTYGTTIASGSEATIIAAAGAGTSTFIQNISVLVHGTASVSGYIGWGTADAQGTQSVIRGVLASEGGGIEKQFPYNISAANTALNGSVSAGSISVNVSYFTGT